jgi:PAS domain S-box-containing protein
MIFMTNKPKSETKNLSEIITKAEFKKNPELYLRYIRLFETAQDGILILDFSTGKIEDANPFITDLLGYSKEELIGKQLWEIGSFLDQDAAKLAFKELHDKGYVRYDDLPLKHKNGKVLEVEFVSNAYQVGSDRVIQCNIRDVSDRRKSEEDLRISKALLEKQNWAILAYAHAAIALSKADDEATLIKDVCTAIVKEAPYVLAWVGMAESDDNKTVRVAGLDGIAVKYAENLQLTWSENSISGIGPVGECIRSGKSTLVSNTEQDPRFRTWLERASKFNIHCVVATPIHDEIKTIGALAVYSTMTNAFSQSEIQLFENLSDEIGYGLRAIKHRQELASEVKERQKIQVQLTKALESTIEAMSKTMEWRDPYTAGHQRRVAEIAVLLGKQLGLNENQLQGLHMAGMVHDIGKVAIPSEILTKPTALTELERKMVQGHVESGYQILKDVPFSWPIADMVRQHHERIDGSGYPLGLKGNEILFESKILAVADTIEAMASHRPYRPAKSLELTFSEIKSLSGSCLDEDVVKAAIELFEDQVLIKKILEH